MDTVRLVEAGMKVSHFCLGAMMFGPTGNPDHDECIRMTHAALDAGVNFIDTADAYTEGESERILAKALKGRRDNVILATKCFFPAWTSRAVLALRGKRKRWWGLTPLDHARGGKQFTTLRDRLYRRLPTPSARLGHGSGGNDSQP